MNLKKILVIGITITVLSTSLWGCGTKEPTPQKESAENFTQEKTPEPKNNSQSNPLSKISLAEQMNKLTQQKKAGDIIIEAMFVNPMQSDNQEQVKFYIYFSGEKDKFEKYRNVAELATLFTADGREIHGFTWQEETMTEKRFSGLLTVQNNQNGKPVFQKEDESITLKLGKIEDQELTFKWMKKDWE